MTDKCIICDDFTEIGPVCEKCNAGLFSIKEDLWEKVYETYDLNYAEYICSSLNELDIPAVILSQSDTALPFSLGELAIIKIMSPPVFYLIAVNTIAEIEENITGLTDTENE